MSMGPPGMPAMRPPPNSLPKATRSCGLVTGSDFSMRLLMRVKMAVLAPMPRASERMATAVKPGLFAIMRRL